MAQLAVLPAPTDQYVGALVGESTSREFRLAVAHEAVREQDLVVVDAELRRPDAAEPEQLRVWAKIQRIERLNPLFPIEAGHELAATRTNPLETVLSLSREMVTAVCQVLGAEPIAGGTGGKLDHLCYPARPATTAYRPGSQDVARVVLGELGQNAGCALDIATLSNRPDVDVLVDGHAIVSRHLAILAMTGAGKSWTARRIIEELAAKNYPIVIFDPHGDYSGLGDVPALAGRVRRYYAQFPIFEQDAGDVAKVVEALSRALSNTHLDRFDGLFRAAKGFIGGTPAELAERAAWLSDYLGNSNIARYGIKPNLFLLADVIQAAVVAGQRQDAESVDLLREWGDGGSAVRLTKQEATWLGSLPGNLRRAAKRLKQMEEISRRVARTTEPLPTNRLDLVAYGGISVVALAGYRSELQATIYSLVAESIFGARVSGELPLPVLFVLEEAHNFAPARALKPAEEHAVATTKQIAQEGRKFGVGLVLISQRPSRLDETTLSQCNSYVIMRMANPADQNYVRRVIETLGEAEAEMLPDLDIGEALLSGQLINFPVLVRMKEPKSKGEREEEDAFVALERAHRTMSGPSQ